jgi:hypothetical protein
MISTMRDLLSMPQAELDSLFRASAAGAMPDGDMDGIAIFAAVAAWTAPAARLVTRIAWRGKVFDAHTGTLVNKLAPFNLRAVKANVSWQASWMDGREAIVLDYSKTSLLARYIRDEIREVAPGVYLGQVYLGRRRICNFALTPSGVRQTHAGR